MNNDAPTTMLSLRGIGKRYPGVTALDGVDIDIRPHEVVGLIGENGAGKSTLLKVLAGLVVPDVGTISLRGAAVRFRSIMDANRAGIGMVFQEQSLLPNMTVAENIYLGQERPFVSGGILRWPALVAAAREQLAKVGLDIDPRMLTEHLSFAQRQMVEIAKALAIQERVQCEPVILLDEPTSVLEQAEVDVLFGRIRELKQIASVVFISHRLDEVLAASDRVYVLRDGHRVAERDVNECDVAELRHLMVGREHSGDFYAEELQSEPRDQPPVLSVRGLGRRGKFAGIDLDIRPGEILGIAGVEGSGREALCRALFGAEPWDAGTVTVEQQPCRPRTPADAVAVGIGYVPAERRVEGVALAMSVLENVTLVALRQFLHRGVLDRSRERAGAADWVQRLAIKTPKLTTGLGTLSGGNQQKVALAKWMISSGVRLMILDHPARGLDVGAKSDVYRFIREMAAAGIAIVLIADTLDETIGLSHRIIVMRDGEITREFAAPAGAKPSPELLVERMV